jgi:predicted nucleic acid-binding protein
MIAPRAFALDTNILIFAVEGADNDDLVLACRKLVFETPGLPAFVVSEIILAELLVRPLREGNLDLVRFYRRLLTDMRAFRIAQASRGVLLEAARLRSVSNLKLADAVHLATATRLGCRGLVTLDGSLRASGAVPALSPADALTNQTK